MVEVATLAIADRSVAGSVGRRVAADVAAGLGRRVRWPGCRGRGGRPTGSGRRPSCRSRSTDSPAVTATGTMLLRRLDQRDVEQGRQPAARLDLGRRSSRGRWGGGWAGSRPNFSQVHPPDRLLLRRTGQVEEERAVEPLATARTPAAACETSLAVQTTNESLVLVVEPA